MNARRSALRALAVLGLLVLGVGGALLAARLGDASAREDRAALVAYEDAFLVPAKRAGGVLELQMKPQTGEFHEGERSAGSLLAQTRVWESVFRAARAEMQALDPPAFLLAVESLWLEAMDAYLEAIEGFAGAARASGAAREEAYQDAIVSAKRGDERYDAASRLIQAARARLGMPPSPDFPDPASRAG